MGRSASFRPENPRGRTRRHNCVGEVKLAVDRTASPSTAVDGTESSPEAGQADPQIAGGTAPPELAAATEPPQAGPPPGAPEAVPARTGLAALSASPRVRHAAVILGFLAAGVALTWPRVTYLSGSVPESRDSAAYVWGFFWVAHQVTHLGNPWFTGHMAAPVGVDLGFHTLMPLAGLVMTPVTLLAGPAAAYNVAVIAVPGLLCYTMYRAARLWLPSATGAVAAGAFFGLSAMLTEQAWYHLNIAAGALFLPMALEASVRLRRQPGRRQAVILGLVMGTAILTDQESAVLAGIITALALVPWLARRFSWERARPLALATAVAGLLAVPQIVAMLQEAGVGGLAIPASTLAVSYKQYGIGLPGMFTPTPRVTDFGLSVLASPFLHGRDNEGMPMFGAVLTVLAVMGLVMYRRRRGAWLLAGLWAGGAALALGASLWIGKHQYLPLAATWHGVRVSDLMPYTWFVRIPGLSSFREADRLAILALMPACLLAGAAVDWLRRHWVPLVAVVAVLGLMEAGYSGDSHIGRMPASYPRLDGRIAADHSHSIVLDIPFGLRGGIPVYGVPFFPQALVMATEDGHPRAVAYVARVPENTIDALNNHPFYRYLVNVQHEFPASCPWELDGCFEPLGAAQADLIQPASLKIAPTSSDIAAAKRDAARMHIGWAVVWKRNPSNQAFVLSYLHETGFRYAYRYALGKDSKDSVLVYRHFPR